MDRLQLESMRKFTGNYVYVKVLLLGRFEAQIWGKLVYDGNEYWTVGDASGLDYIRFPSDSVCTVYEEEKRIVLKT